MADFLELNGSEEFNFFKLAKNSQKLQGSFLINLTRELKHSVLNENERVSFSIEGFTDEDKKPYLKVQIQANLKLQCQRCLDELALNLDLNSTYLLSSKEEEEFLEQKILFCRESSNLIEFLEEELILSLPMIAKHEDCSLPIDLVEDIPKNNPFEQLKFLMNKE